MSELRDFTRLQVKAFTKDEVTIWSLTTRYKLTGKDTRVVESKRLHNGYYSERNQRMIVLKDNSFSSGDFPYTVAAAEPLRS